jgi:hypothetical protein
LGFLVQRALILTTCGPGPVEAEGTTTSYQDVLRDASLVVGHYQGQDIEKVRRFSNVDG